MLALIFECGVGCALAGVLLCPAMLFMLSITRTGAGDTSLLTQTYTLGTLLERVRALLMPIESNVVHAYYGDAPSWASTAAYLPVFGLTGAVALFGQKKHRWLKGLLLALAVCSAVPVLCGAFALETNVAYTRWWYGVALMTTLATLTALRDADGRALRRAFIALTALTLLLTVPFLLPEGWQSRMGRVGAALLSRRKGAYADDVFRVFSVCAALLGGGAMLFVLIRKPCFAVTLALVCAVAAAQYAGYILVGDESLLSGGDVAGEGLYTLPEIAEPTLKAAAAPDMAEWQRIDYGKKIRNYGLLRGASSLTAFTSLRSSIIGRFISMAGFGFDESTTVCPPDGGGGAARAAERVKAYYQPRRHPCRTASFTTTTKMGLPYTATPTPCRWAFCRRPAPAHTTSEWTARPRRPCCSPP